MYDSKIPRWITQDPLAEKYYSTSPYAYCGGNPVNRIDPDGMKWDNVQEAETLKKEIETTKTTLKNQIKANTTTIANSNSKKEIRKLNRENKGLTERVSRLDQSQNNIDAIGADQNETYAFAQSTNGTGYVEKGSDGKVYIYNDGSATKIHEITHVVQTYGKNPTTFLNKVSGLLSQTVGNMGQNEIEAYQNQYSFSPKSYPGRVKSIWDINENAVSKIRDHNGKLVYPLLRKRFNNKN